MKEPPVNFRAEALSVLTDTDPGEWREWLASHGEGSMGLNDSAVHQSCCARTMARSERGTPWSAADPAEAIERLSTRGCVPARWAEAGAGDPAVWACPACRGPACPACGGCGRVTLLGLPAAAGRPPGHRWRRLASVASLGADAVAAVGECVAAMGLREAWAWARPGSRIDRGLGKLPLPFGGELPFGVRGDAAVIWLPEVWR